MKRSAFKVAWELMGLLSPLTGYMMLAIFLGTLGHIAASAITILAGVSIFGENLKIILAAMIICAVIRGFLRYGEQMSNHYIAFKLLALLRKKIFASLLKLAPAKVETKEKGNLISMITQDIELLEVFYAHTISPVAIFLLFSLVMSIFVGTLNLLLGVQAFISFMVIGIAVPVFIAKTSGDEAKKFRDESGALSSFLLERLQGLSEIKRFGQGEKMLEELNLRVASMEEKSWKMKKKAGINVALTSGLIFAADLSMLISAIKFSGEPYTILISTLTLMSSFGPAVSLAGLGSGLQPTFAAGNRVLDLLGEKPSVDEIDGKKDIEYQGMSVEELFFSYGGEDIIKGLSLKIPKSKILGLTGKSGSGKSTFLKLLMRFWKINSGKISVGENSLEEINTKNLRQMQSYMTQETHLFHLSIAENLKIAKHDATDEELITACKKASIDEFIETLPKGYDTLVGELGDTLSGGERQRLGLARVFLNNSPMILLDEPTANLDSLNEAMIFKAISEEGKEKTAVLISHRPSATKICDEVYAMDKISHADRKS